MKEFKIRCSAIGQIMTNAKKKGELSKTCQTYVQDWLKEQIYGHRKNISSKYLEKGLVMEDASIDFIAEFLDYGFLAKNEEFYTNDFLTGTPDVVLKDHLIDVKNSWDAYTFPLFDDKIPSKDYYWQGQGYMALTGLDNYKLIYTLMDTPEELLNPYTDVPQTYGNVEDKYRVKVFEFEKNQEDIDKIYERVAEIREYIKTIL
jgi:hypothetical protein